VMSSVKESDRKAAIQEILALRARIVLLEGVAKAAEFRARNGCDDSCDRGGPCTCGNVALRAALAALEGRGRCKT
jgi:hypothetical protein